MAPSDSASTKPTTNDVPKTTSSRKTLPELAKEKLEQGNASQLGDPISLKAETADSEPTEEDRGARGTKVDRKTESGTKTGGMGDGDKAKSKSKL